MEQSKNADTHTSHEHGLVSEWGHISVLKCYLYENDDPHMSKENSCSQVYLQMFLQIRKESKREST